MSKKRTRDENLTVTRSKKLSLSLLPDELWLDKYKPVSADQLSVQPKKVKSLFFILVYSNFVKSVCLFVCLFGGCQISLKFLFQGILGRTTACLGSSNVLSQVG